jgi:acetyltransferase
MEMDTTHPDAGYFRARRLTDGTPICVRTIQPEDEAMMVKFHTALSDRSVYYRYFTPLPLATRTNHTRLARTCHPDGTHEVALVAVHEGAGEPPAEILGVGRLCIEVANQQAEFALVVADGYQRRGLGTILLNALSEVAGEKRLTRIYGIILSDNVAMRALCERNGFSVHRSFGETEYVASKPAYLARGGGGSCASAAARE